jgi:glycosyltransferase involved in cell wall biosynthesis
MGNPRPLLIIGDAVSSNSGLGRIGRDLATRIHEHLSDVYRVATFGSGGVGSCKLPFTQFSMENMRDWVLPSLPDVVNDFFGEERGIILFIWDLSRVSWFSQPQAFAELTNSFPGLQRWLSKQNYEKWIYCPIDASGPNDRLTFPLMKTLLGFDRILAYGSFGEGVIRRTIGDEQSDKRHLTNLPHGIDGEVFCPLPRNLCRKAFFQRTGAMQIVGDALPLQKDEVLIGIVATNQHRKDWALGLQTVSILSRTHKIRLWIHTDEMERYWSITALLIDYALIDKTVVSLGVISDEHMGAAYSACDFTLGIGPEGFGYCIHESLFCGTPCLHGDYGGAPEWILGHVQGVVTRHDDEPLLVKPWAYRFEGVYASERPVFSPQDWAKKASELIGKRTNRNGEIDWVNLWPRWKAYLREAAK